MCKGKSMIVTENNIFYLNDDEFRDANSHELIKFIHEIKDGILQQDKLLIVEMIPLVSLESKEKNDWRIITETSPSFFEENREKIINNIFETLFEKIIPRWIEKGIIYLNVANCGLTQFNNKNISLQELDCSNNKITQIICSDSLQRLDCSNNKITQIICNDALKVLYCRDNLITQIVCNNNLQELYCRNNKLTQIICNDNLEKLYCSDNNITQIICNDKLKELICRGNQITQIICNNNLEKLYCRENNIKQIICNNNLKEFICDKDCLRIYKKMEG